MGGDPLDLRDQLRILRRTWRLALTFVVVGAMAALAATWTTPKLYQASVRVFVATSTTIGAGQLAQGNMFTQLRVQSYISIAQSPAVTGPVLRKLQLPLTDAQLASQITADAPQNQVLINLHVIDTNPVEAATIANAVANQFDEAVAHTEQLDTQGKPVVKLSVIQPATVPTVAIEPRGMVNLLGGIVLGLLVGIGVITVREVLDNRVKGPRDFDALGIPILGYVPFDKSTGESPNAFRRDQHGSRCEAYRQLRTNLRFVDVDGSPRVIAVTSAVPGEGKSTTALNLAAALAEGGLRVCLVDADLRRPSLAETLGLIEDVGLTTVLAGGATLDQVLQRAGPNLFVLTSGRIPPNPNALLISAKARATIQEVSQRFDYTIIDTAPLLAVADGAQIASLAEATLVVSHLGQATIEQAASCVKVLARVGIRPAGFVLNMISQGRGGYGHKYGYYYDAYRPRLTDTEPSARMITSV